MDITANFSNEKELGVPGGHLMQLYYILEEIKAKYPTGLKNYMEKKIQNDDEEYFLKPNVLRELMLPDHLMPFLMQYIKDMRNS